MARPSSLAKLPAATLRAELQRRERQLAVLRRRHARAVRMVTELEDAIRRLGGRAQHPGRRPRNNATLPEHIASALKGKVMSVPEVTEAVLKRGYRSNAQSLRLLVNYALLKHKDLFKRVGRGRYTGK